jgi:hypothetical protein
MSLPIADDPVITGMTDDTGTGQDGDVVNKAMFEAIAEAIDEALVDSTTPSAQTPAETTAEVIEARGAMASLDERISGVIDENGDLIEEISGIVDVDGTCGEDIGDRKVAYYNSGLGGGAKGFWYLASANNRYTSMSARLVGVCVGGALSGATGRFRILGYIDGFTGLKVGVEYFIATTAGELDENRPTLCRSVGVARFTTALYVDNTQLFGAMVGRSAGLIGSSSAATTTSGTGTTETQLANYRISQYSLPRDGDTLTMTAVLTINNTAFAKTIRVKFGATAVALTVAAGAAYTVSLFVEILRVSGSSQRMCVTCSGAWQNSLAVTASPAELLSSSVAGAVDFEITGQNTDAADVIAHFMSAVRIG